MKIKDLFAAVADISREKNIDYEVLLEAIGQGLLAAYKKTWGDSGNIRIEINEKEKMIHVFALKKVVDTVEDPHNEVTLRKAKKLNKDVELGSEIDIEITPESFGRFAASTCKQIVMQRLKEAEKKKIIDEFEGKEKQMVFGEVSRMGGKGVYFKLGNAEGLLPKSEQIPGEVYGPGRKFHCYVLRMDRTSREPLVILSRTHPGLLQRLMEHEIPEIEQGVIEIIGIVREPGLRAKVAVNSLQERVDPVGSCIGTKGVRINVVSDELKGERIDVVRWFEDPRLFIASSLSPAKVYSVQIIPEDKRAIVYVEPDQFSLAIGKKGSNVRLASRLTGFRVDMMQLEE
ncbi:MAG TPA: transcription termination factor NusA [Caldisericia bacterium]|nr:transcription termination factor NusA [Caldisericia bacterium]HPF48140.1 transcription termination factor NusA [Caldisericia bacterium]HPI83924.1 transcription termination factor NusA [Caldisericia bacterium]HPQ92593.1 transcription termination factor NusA [Caldisericia bacterium]HRV74309.1 transcription termination factor NusA [Caldisericia bacterium]